MKRMNEKRDYDPGSKNRVFYVNSQTMVEVVVEHEYAMSLISRITIAGLWRKLTAQIKNMPGWDVDIVNQNMWIVRDEGGSAVRTYHLTEVK